MLGLTGCAVAQLSLAVAPALWAAVAAAMLLGLLLRDLRASEPGAAGRPDRRRPQRAAAYSALGAAIAAAGVVAGLLAALLAGFGMRWLFVADAVTCLACARWWGPPFRQFVGTGAAAGGDAGPWRDRRLLAMLAARHRRSRRSTW